MIGYLFYKFSSFLCLRLPLRFCYAVATTIAVIKYYVSPRDRLAVLANLEHILPASEMPHIHRYAQEVFINFARYLVEFFRFPLLKKEDLNHAIKIIGREYIDEGLRQGKGVIIISAHMGNWELGGFFMSLLGYPMIAVALPHRHQRVNTFFNQKREKMGAVVVSSLGLAVRRIYDALRQNKAVALVGDRDFSNGGRRMDFLGLTKVIPRGPAVLSRRTQAPIIPGFVFRQDSGIYVLEFLKPLSSQGTEEEIMAAYTKVIETQIRQHPSQWLLFREFWKE